MSRCSPRGTKRESPGATILESTGLARMQKAIWDDLPLVPSVRDLLGTRELHHRTLFTVVQDEKAVDCVIAATQEVIGDLNTHHTGILFVVPVGPRPGAGAKVTPAANPHRFPGGSPVRHTESRCPGETPRFLVLLALLALSLLAACGGPALTMSPTPPPMPIPAPSPVPTLIPTPMPPVPLRIRFPSVVSALDEPFVVVEAPGLPERDPSACLRATIYAPDLPEPFWESPLEMAGDGVYRSRAPVHFPLEPIPGEWTLEVFVRSRACPGNPLVSLCPASPCLLYIWLRWGPQRASLQVPQGIPPSNKRETQFPVSWSGNGKGNGWNSGGPPARRSG